MTTQNDRINRAIVQLEEDTELLHTFRSGTEDEVIYTNGGMMPSVAGLVKEVRSKTEINAQQISIATEAAKASAQHVVNAEREAQRSADQASSANEAAQRADNKAQSSSLSAQSADKRAADAERVSRDASETAEQAAGLVRAQGERIGSLDQFNADLANPDNGVAMVARGVVAVDSIADLLALSEGQRKEGLRYLIASFWDGWNAEARFLGPSGGGEFSLVRNSNLIHNGGLIIDPSVPHPSEQPGASHTERLSNYLNGVGGGGTDLRFIRVPDGSIGLRPEWFGAKGDAEIVANTLSPGYTDDFAAFRKVIDLIDESQGNLAQGTGLSCLQLSERGYMIGQTLECAGNMRVLGSANPKMVGRGPTAFLTGMPDMINGIFKLNGIPGISWGAFGVEFDHVGFRGYASVGRSRLPCAVYTDATGGPARPFNFLNCHAEGFDDVILIQRSGSSSTTVYNLNCMYSVFFRNINSIRSTGLNALGGLVFDGNVSEQGGRLDVSVFGTVEIQNNLLEGQSDALRITGANAVVTIGPNYFEGNTGYQLYISLTNKAKIVIEPQHIGGSSGQMFNVVLGTNVGDILLLGDHSGTVLHHESHSYILTATSIGSIPNFIDSSAPAQNTNGGVRRASAVLSEAMASSMWIEIPPNAKVSRVFSREGSTIYSEYGPMGTQKEPTSPQYTFVGDSSAVAGDIFVHCAMIYCENDERSLGVQLLKSSGNYPQYATATLRRGWNRFFYAFEFDSPVSQANFQYIGNLTGIYVGTQAQYIVPKIGEDDSPTRIGWSMPAVIG